MGRAPSSSVRRLVGGRTWHRVQPHPEQEEQPGHQHPETGPDVDVDAGGLLARIGTVDDSRDEQDDAVEHEQPADDPADVEGPAGGALVLRALGRGDRVVVAAATVGPVIGALPSGEGDVEEAGEGQRPATEDHRRAPPRSGSRGPPATLVP